MGENNVAERLKSYIEKKGYSYSQFADMCGIPRPSLSQLLTGRNKKISDILAGQIHNTFPDLSILWLLFGEGPMENQLESVSDINKIETIFKEDLGSTSLEGENQGREKIIFSGGDQNQEKMDSQGLKNTLNTKDVIDNKEISLKNKIKELQSHIEKLKKNPRRVVQINIYYDDSTFETFVPM